jgi:8-oxo-dGTP pyrophosphatase MutT (NUDIX family)
MPMKDARVVTSFLLRRTEADDEILLLRRSLRVGTYRGLWAGVSGYLEAPVPLDQALREIGEEVGLSAPDVQLIAEGEPLVIADDSIGVRWTVYPFLFLILKPDHLWLDWEHVEAKWTSPSDITQFHTVPGLREALDRVYRPSTDPLP